MFKKYLLNPLLVVATFLGMSGINTTASAVDDKQIVSDMSIQFAKYYESHPQEGLKWINHNSVGKALKEPFKNIYSNNPALINYYELQDLSCNLIGCVNFSKVEVVNFTNMQNAYSIVSNIVDSGHKRMEKQLLHKIWFKKVKEQWKISDYYTLLVKNTYEGQPMPTDTLLLGGKGYDSVGTEFPY